MTTPVLGQPLATIDGQVVTVRDIGDLQCQIEARLDACRGFTLYTLNLDHLVKRRQNVAFREAYARATFVTADGWPVVSLAREQTKGIKLTTGADLVVPLSRLAARRRVPVFLFGSDPAILERAATRLRSLCPGLKIVGCEAPPHGFSSGSDAAREAMSRIAASGASLCFVALGAPKQEMFSDLASVACPGVGFVCIGAALDFLAGARRRAPVAIQRLRLEWAWRLALEPRRLGLRYLLCFLLFARLAIRQAA